MTDQQPDSDDTTMSDTNPTDDDAQLTSQSLQADETSINDALRLSESGFNMVVGEAVSDLVDSDDIQTTLNEPEASEVRSWARDWVADHEWFNPPSGATMGAIVEHGAEPVRDSWSLVQDQEAALVAMAQEAFAQSVADRLADVLGAGP